MPNLVVPKTGVDKGRVIQFIPLTNNSFVKLGKQFAERGEFHPPVPFFDFIPEVTGRLQSHDMNADMGGQVPEDGVVGLGFAARPFKVALECLDLHFEASFNGSLPHRPDKVRFQQGVYPP